MMLVVDLVVVPWGSECVVSMQPQSWPEPDPQVAAAIRAMYRGRREAPLAVQVRDRLGELFPDAAFADAFGQVGKPGWSPGRLALVTVLQKAANLTDRQAADEVRENLAWKYALGLDLEDPGFDHSVLSEFRSRVVAHGLEERVLDLLLERLQTLDLVQAGARQRTDSTHIVAAVRDLNRLELVGESVRAALNALAAACPEWVDQVLVVEDWSHRYADRIDNWRLPSSKTKQYELALAYAADGFTLLQALYAPASPGWLRELPAVQTLRCVLVQNYTRTTDRAGRLRIRQRERTEDGGDGLPPAPIRLASPYDTDTRWSAKRETFWNGYKLHVSETCHPQADGDRPTRPNLITHVTTTRSTRPVDRLQLHTAAADGRSGEGSGDPGAAPPTRRAAAAGRQATSDRALLAALLQRLSQVRLHQIHLIVSADTVLCRHRELLRRRHAKTSRPKRRGRPRTLRSIRALVLRLVRENPEWGYRPVHGELAAPGIKVAASTVLKFPPGPGQRVFTLRG
jgi:transposase